MMHFAGLMRVWTTGIVLATGCSQKPGNPDVVPVTGKVMYQGQPVADANVVFQSEQQQGGFGVTDAQGRFRLQTFEPGDGALPGEYRVIISKVHITVPEFDVGHPQHVPPPPPKHLVPQKYASAATAGLTATVVKGDENEFSFELKD